MEKENTVDLTLERDLRTVPIAKQILNIIAGKKDLMIGSCDDVRVKVNEYYNEIYEKDIAPLLIKENVRINELTYIFQLCYMALENVKLKVEHTIPLRMEQADAFLWGVNDMDDLTISQLVEVLEKKFSTTATETTTATTTKEEC